MEDTMAYTLLEAEKLPEVLKNKPKWVTCVAFATAVLVIVASAISVGVLIGYTYCYIEHHSGFKSDNSAPNLQIIQVPYTNLEESAGNRTINNALMSSSVLISRILKMGHALMQEELSYLPWSQDTSNVSREFI